MGALMNVWNIHDKSFQLLKDYYDHHLEEITKAFEQADTN